MGRASSRPQEKQQARIIKLRKMAAELEVKRILARATPEAWRLNHEIRCAMGTTRLAPSSRTAVTLQTVCAERADVPYHCSMVWLVMRSQIHKWLRQAEKRQAREHAKRRQASGKATRVSSLWTLGWLVLVLTPLLLLLMSGCSGTAGRASGGASVRGLRCQSGKRVAPPHTSTSYSMVSTLKCVSCISDRA